MSNTINVETELDGDRNLVLEVAITGDGSGDESATELVDVSGFGLSPDRVKIHAITGALTGFSAALEWNASANELACEIPEGYSFQDFEHTGGIINRAGSGVNGDIDITTVGLGDGDTGTIRLELRKKFT